MPIEEGPGGLPPENFENQKPVEAISGRLNEFYVVGHDFTREFRNQSRRKK